YNHFTFLDVGDLTWDKEMALACPVNELGRVSLLLATHHGFFNDQSGAPALLWAIQPRVVIANNGPRKGMADNAYERIQKVKGLEGLWQSHLALAAERSHNAPDDMIPTMEPSPHSKELDSCRRRGGRPVRRHQRAEQFQQELSSEVIDGGALVSASAGP